MRSLIWFREDLRLDDNIALMRACDYADTGVLAVYVIDPQGWNQHEVAACRVDFILRSLKMLSQKLLQYNIALRVLQLQSSDELIASLLMLIKQHSIDAVFFNKQYEFNESQRDAKLVKCLQDSQIKVFSYHDQTIFPPGTVLTQQSTPFTVFTPFKNAWLRHWTKNGCEVAPPIKKPKQLISSPDIIPTDIAGFFSSIPIDAWPAGESAAQQRLENFTESKIRDYAEKRDFPALEGTSKLSPYLASGLLSPRQCLHSITQTNQGDIINNDKGITTWVTELIWRDFYKNILVFFPRVSKNQPFKLSTNNIAWQNNPQHILAWQKGQTGYPFVDAAMRQLLATGWMHNRLRMVTAMFFCKTLFLDWRLGEQYFMQHLIDGDLAANNGGWQWSASTGTDAVPYFRIFNPILQSMRFDPQGDFIRQYCPEIAHLDNKSIHQPHENSFQIHNFNYPAPIVSHAINKEKVLASFKKLNP